MGEGYGPVGNKSIVLGVEAPGWRGAPSGADSPSVTEARRRQSGCIGRENDRVTHSRPLGRVRIVLASLALLGGCDLARDAPGADAAPGDAAPPVDDLVEPVGGPDTLDVACWNLEWFPKTDATVSLAAALITSLDLDVIVVEEIASVDGWDELIARLPDHAGVLSEHRYTPTSYQKIGVIYREGLVTPGDAELLFTGDSYAFPRPGLRVPLTVGDLTLDVVGVHLKAGVTDDDAARRAAAFVAMDQWVRAAAEDQIVVAGDYNEDLDPPGQETVMAPFVDAPELYTFRTAGLAAADVASFVPYQSLIDHIVTIGELGGGDAVIPDLEAQLQGYVERVSDHLPVILSIPR